MWPCVVAPGEAGVWMRAGSLSVVLLHGVCSSATWRYTRLSQESKSVPHAHEYLTAKWESHSFVQTRRENNWWTGQRCANYTTLALSSITLPPPPHKTKNKNTCALSVAQPLYRRACCDYRWSGMKAEVTWGFGSSEPILPQLFRSRASSCSSRSEANTRLSATRSASALSDPEPASVGGSWDFTLQPVCSVCARHVLDTFTVPEWMFRRQTSIRRWRPSPHNGLRESWYSGSVAGSVRPLSL